jgi:hypothetical protein
MTTGTEQAHKLLELLITKALVSGTTSTRTVLIPYDELAHALRLNSKFKTDLKIEIKLTWNNEAYK